MVHRRESLFQAKGQGNQFGFSVRQAKEGDADGETVDLSHGDRDRRIP